LIVASSGSMLVRLAESLPSEALRKLSGSTPIVLSSDRLCQQAQALGFRRCVPARSALPEALVEAAIAASESFTDALDTHDSVSMRP
jgi:uroporphyrinogen-III synthase